MTTNQPLAGPRRRMSLVTLAATILLASCQLFSTTPDPDRRSAIRNAVPYGMTEAAARSKLSGLGFACSSRSGDYAGEDGVIRSAARFLNCIDRPRQVSFACEYRDQVTVITREGLVSGIEVVRAPSCQQESPQPLQIK